MKIHSSLVALALIASAFAGKPALAEQLHYTNHVARPLQTETIAIRLDASLTGYERAKILRAVNEWNYVLNGHVRFDVLSDAPGLGGPPAWMVVKSDGSRVQSRNRDQMLAVTQPTGAGGGLVIVLADRLGGRDLGAVMLHELGHVLGLEHDSSGHLMSARYSGNNQQCVDKAAADALAVARKLPLSDLNWCEV